MSGGGQKMNGLNGFGFTDNQEMMQLIQTVCGEGNNGASGTLSLDDAFRMMAQNAEGGGHVSIADNVAPVQAPSSGMSPSQMFNLS